MRELPKKVLLIDYIHNDPWMLPVLSAINDAIERNKLKGIKSTKELGNISLSISRRLDFIPIIVCRLKKNTKEFLNHVSKRDNNNDGYAFKADEWLVYKILIDIDSFLFEINSCCELMRKLVEKIMKYIGISNFEFASFVNKICKENKHDISWFSLLGKERNRFIHDNAPFFDIDISNEKEQEYDFLIQKENLYEYKDSDKFIRLSEFDTILNGFKNIRQLLQVKLIELLIEKKK